MWLVKVRSQRYKKGKKEETQLSLVKEKEIRLSLAQEKKCIWTMAEDEKAFVVGYYYNHGQLQTHLDLTRLSKKEDLWSLTTESEEQTKTPESRACSKEWLLTHMGELTKTFQQKAEPVKKRGFGSSAAIMSQEGQVYFAEGLDQNEAIYSAIGKALINKVCIQQSALIIIDHLNQQRINSYEKLAVKTLITRGGISYSAMELAKSKKMAIVTYAREQRFTLMLYGDNKNNH
ncbi:MAG: hypothetical protein VW378_01665 [bacterium]